jgi:hypothetical protein
MGLAKGGIEPHSAQNRAPFSLLPAPFGRRSEFFSGKLYYLSLPEIELAHDGKMGLAKGRKRPYFQKGKKARMGLAKGRIELHSAFRQPNFHYGNRALFRKSQMVLAKGGLLEPHSTFCQPHSAFGNPTY